MINKTCFNCHYEPSWIDYHGKHNNIIKKVGRCYGSNLTLTRIPANSLEHKRKFFNKTRINLMPIENTCTMWTLKR